MACTISCGNRRSIVDQSLGATVNRTINRSIVRPIVATYDRSYNQLWHQTTDRTIHRGIVRPIVRSIMRLPIRDHPQLAVGVTMHDWWYDHVKAPLHDTVRPHGARRLPCTWVNRNVWHIARMSRTRENRVKRNLSSFYFRADSAARAVRLPNQCAADT